MADKQISDLTSASALTDGSLFVLEQAGAAMKANWGMMKDYISPGVAAQYSTSATYDVGDYVIYNGQLYRCTTAITTAESWTAAHWTAAVLGNDVGELKSQSARIYDDAYDAISIEYTGYDKDRALSASGKNVVSGSTILSYPVTAGEVIKVDLTNRTSGNILFFFQDTQTVPWSSNTHIIGQIYTGDHYSGYLTVPIGATHLVTNVNTEAIVSVVWKTSFECMKYRETLSGAYTDAEVGTYAVSRANVSGLPSGMGQDYGWLTCFVKNNLYMLVESDAFKTTWIKEGGGDWIGFNDRLSYKEGYNPSSISVAPIGIYAVSRANVSGLPSGMSQDYGWLICYVPNSLYAFVESDNLKTTWLKEGSSDWVKTYPSGANGNNRLGGKLIAYNGDSIAESRFSGFASNGGGYPYLISQIVGGTYENKAVSGGTLAVSSAGHHICETISTMSDDADIICIDGGINDYWLDVPLGDFSESDFTGTVDNTTVCGALESIFRQAINKWIGKPIVFVIVHKITTTAWTANGAGYTFAEARQKMIGICEKYSIPYVDMWANGGLNAYMSALDNAFLNGGGNTHPDGCHPDVNGYKKYYVPRLIAEFESLLPYDI